MIVKEDFMIREDGVQLIKRFDGVLVGYDSQGKPIYEPTGLMIRKAGTDDLYDMAIDVENAPYSYVETDKKIEEEEKEEEEYNG